MANTDDLYLEFVASLKIDKINLDETLRQQPTLFNMVCDQVHEKYKLAEQAKLNVETVKAATCQTIREEALKAGSKVTEGSVDEKCNINTEYVNARMAYIDANSVFKKWSDLKDAFYMRHEELKEISRLTQAGFSTI